MVKYLVTFELTSDRPFDNQTLSTKLQNSIKYLTEKRQLHLKSLEVEVPVSLTNIVVEKIATTHSLDSSLEELLALL